MLHHPKLLVVQAEFPEADAVYLVGPFNNWSTVDTPMISKVPGIWEATLTIIPELRQCCFFVWEKGCRFGRIVHRSLTISPGAPDLSHTMTRRSVVVNGISND